MSFPDRQGSLESCHCQFSEEEPVFVCSKGDSRAARAGRPGGGDNSYDM
jgi:hypothetical protein